MKILQLLTSTLLTCLLWLADSAPLAARQPGTATPTALVPYQARYQASASGLSATATRTLQQLDGGYYELSQSMEVRVLGAKLGAITETSQFHFNNNTVIPDTYSYVQSGISSRSERVEYNWAEAEALSSEDERQWQVPLESGVVDKLNFQLALRLALLDTELEEVSIRLVDGDELETQVYRVVGNETIETGAGLLDTLKIQRIREPGASRQTLIWLARDWQLLLVKFEQTSGSGSTTRLLLDSATIDGQPIMAGR